MVVLILNKEDFQERRKTLYNEKGVSSPKTTLNNPTNVCTLLPSFIIHEVKQTELEGELNP